jgi:hypothetical protein
VVDVSEGVSIKHGVVVEKEAWVFSSHPVKLRVLPLSLNVASVVNLCVCWFLGHSLRGEAFAAAAKISAAANKVLSFLVLTGVSWTDIAVAAVGSSSLNAEAKFGVAVLAFISTVRPWSRPSGYGSVLHVVGTANEDEAGMTRLVRLVLSFLMPK